MSEMGEQLHLARAYRDVFSGYSAFMPPKRISVSQSAVENLVIKQTGGPATNWSVSETPYMAEPMDMLASRKHESVCFVGPARTGKTGGLVLGFMAHAIVTDPGDMLIISMTQDKARELSKTDIDRALRYSPTLAAMRSASSQDDTVHDKMFKNGMWLRIAWPTVSNVSGSTYRYAVSTDYDRVEDDIGGEGALYGLLVKRTTTFLSRGMCAVESSPGRDLTDPHWRPVTAHEAPPVGGILGIYNRSDRRRWYWQCPDCSDHFEAEPGLGLFHLPPENELIEIVREVDIQNYAKKYGRVICPHCGSLIDFKWRSMLNAKGKWVQDGQRLNRWGELEGTPLTSNIAGYWLGGVAATYQKWTSLIERYLQGLRDYALTGMELSLKTTVNTDQGMPYMSRHLAEAVNVNKDPADRPNKDLQRFVVPDWTRLVVASVDVQGGKNARFDVQVHAIGPHMEQALVNRFQILDSRREGMGSVHAPIDPAAYGEDWDRITDEVVRSTYQTSIEGREIRVKLVVVDSGGEDGVTDKAYQWMRKMRRANLGVRVMLFKGTGLKSAPLIRESMLGGRTRSEKGDVPVYVCNTNLLADAISANLKRTKPGPGYYHFPEPKGPNNPDGWLPKSFFDELAAEVRNENGTWEQVRKRNESFDHCKMIYAGLLRLGVDKIKDWSNAPTWAQPLDSNSEIVTSDQRREMKQQAEDEARREAESRVAVRRQRRVAHSPYLS